MATYLTGDIQGCFDELQQLLALAEFNPAKDRLWLTGDLVARGPKSLETLRWVKDMGDSALTVLGNHDLHLLACVEGFAQVKAKDQLTALIEAEDSDELLYWLRQQPLYRQHPEHGFVMTHAGIPPQWSIQRAEQAARAVEQVLHGEDYRLLLKQMYGNGPALWHDKLSQQEKVRFTINALTRMRFVDRDTHALDMQMKCSPKDNPDQQLVPWFNCREHHQDPPLIFGHWAALEGETQHTEIIALDTGCVWGNSLTLLCWETQRRYALPCPLYT
jgi:bis(5'-nucleosyl)-tetraphosphatase (symmetrical)